MPYSETKFDNEIREFVLTSFPDRRTLILDIGAGTGKFRDLLFDYPNMDAIEAWQPNHVEFRLKERYRSVIVADVMEAPEPILRQYELTILGDILEHLSVTDAQKLLHSINGTILVTVPYLYEQGTVDENPFEIHKQPDLTHELFIDRYSGFRLLIGDSEYGVYINDGKQKMIGKMRMPSMKNMDVDLSKFKDANIAVCTPLISGSVNIKYTISLCETLRRFIEAGIGIEMLIVSGQNVCQARNRLVASFMSNPSYTHLMFIDGDHGWVPENVFRLLAMNKPIVGVVSRKKIPNIKWAANIPEGEVYIDDTGAMDLTDIGTGFTLFKREVFDAMFAAYPKLFCVHPDPEVSQVEAENYYRLFEFHVDDDGIERSEDITFCRRWREIGGHVYCDPAASISHMGIYDFRGSISSLFLGEASDESADESEREGKGNLRQING